MNRNLEHIDFLLKQMSEASFHIKGGDVALLLNAFKWLVDLRSSYVEKDKKENKEEDQKVEVKQEKKAKK